MKRGKKAIMQAQFWKALRKALYEDVQAEKGRKQRQGDAA